MAWVIELDKSRYPQNGTGLHDFWVEVGIPRAGLVARGFCSIIKNLTGDQKQVKASSTDSPAVLRVLVRRTFMLSEVGTVCHMLRESTTHISVMAPVHQSFHHLIHSFVYPSSHLSSSHSLIYSPRHPASLLTIAIVCFLACSVFSGSRFTHCLLLTRSPCYVPGLGLHGQLQYFFGLHLLPLPFSVNWTFKGRVSKVCMGVTPLLL